MRISSRWAGPAGRGRGRGGVNRHNVPRCVAAAPIKPGRRAYRAKCDTSPMVASTRAADSPYAWLRLTASLALMTLGGVGMYAVIVVLPAIRRNSARRARGIAAVHADDDRLRIRRHPDGAARGPFRRDGAGAGRHGRPRPRLRRRGLAQSVLQFAIVQGLLIGFLGSSATFVPLVADASLWFTRRRGIAVAICASGSYLAGAVWPPVLQHFFDLVGWRQTFVGVGVFCIASMLPLAVALRRRPPAHAAARVAALRASVRATARASARRAAGDPLRRRTRLLRGDVDAAGAHRRLLR